MAASPWGQSPADWNSPLLFHGSGFSPAGKPEAQARQGENPKRNPEAGNAGIAGVGVFILPHAAFLPAAGARTVLCSAEAAQALPFPRRATGEIMALRERAAPVEEAEILWDPSPRLLYPLLCASQTASFLPPPFEPFYLDLSHRTRHGAARSAAIRARDSLAACAICSAKTEEAAVLSAVAVRPDVRRRGFGARVVLALAASLPVDTIYIFRASGENEAFYRTLGFTGHSHFAELDVQERNNL